MYEADLAIPIKCMPFLWALTLIRFTWSPVWLCLFSNIRMVPGYRRWLKGFHMALANLGGRRYNAWLRAKVARNLADSRPQIPHREVDRRMAERVAAPADHCLITHATRLPGNMVVRSSHQSCYSYETKVVARG